MRAGEKGVVDAHAVRVTREKFNDLLGPYVSPVDAITSPVSVPPLATSISETVPVAVPTAA